MSVWPTGAAGRQVSRGQREWRKEFEESLQDLRIWSSSARVRTPWLIYRVFQGARGRHVLESSQFSEEAFQQISTYSAGSGGRTTGLGTADVAAVMVLRNNVVVGSVNASKRRWCKAGEALARTHRSWLARLMKRRERPEGFMKALHRHKEDIKVVFQVAEA